MGGDNNVFHCLHCPMGCHRCDYVCAVMTGKITSFNRADLAYEILTMIPDVEKIVRDNNSKIARNVEESKKFTSSRLKAPFQADNRKLKTENRTLKRKYSTKRIRSECGWKDYQIAYLRESMHGCAIGRDYEKLQGRGRPTYEPLAGASADGYAAEMHVVSLITAVLIQAMRDLRDDVVMYGSDVARKCEAYSWLSSDDKSPFSLSWICSNLDLDDAKVSREVQNILAGDFGKIDSQKFSRIDPHQTWETRRKNDQRRISGEGLGLHQGPRIGDSEIQGGAYPAGGIQKDEEGALDANGPGIGDLDTCSPGAGGVCGQGISGTNKSDRDRSREGGDIEVAISCGRIEDRNVANAIS